MHPYMGYCSCMGGISLIEQNHWVRLLDRDDATGSRFASVTISVGAQS